jgi:tRNA(Leu) C34 or U34 (ribose-2'-O)-methylase TrmL
LKLKPHETQLEDQKVKKAQEDHLEEAKTAKDNKWQEKWQDKEKSKEKVKITKLPLKSTPSNTFNTNSPLR